MFSIRKGTKFHEAKGKHFSAGFGENDTLGLLIYLPDNNKVPNVPVTLKDRVRPFLFSYPVVIWTRNFNYVFVVFFVAVSEI